MASGFMSGCLIFQLPLICSTTSLESIRTSMSAPGRDLLRPCVRPAIRPRYSATLLLATPIVVPSSASTRPVSASLTSAPYAAGPGLPRDAAVGLDDRPAGSGRTSQATRLVGVVQSPLSEVRTRIRLQSSHRITSSSAAARIVATSALSRSRLQPAQRRARRSAAPTPPLLSRSRS